MISSIAFSVLGWVLCSLAAPAKQSYWEEVLKPDVLPVWIGGTAALVASLVGVATLIYIAVQTNASVKAANAAKKSADAQINIERPWLLIESLDLPQFTVVRVGDPRILQRILRYEIKNYGKTPARVRALRVVLAVGDSPEFPPNALDVFGTENFSVNPHIIPQGDKRKHDIDATPDYPLTDEQHMEIARGEAMFLWAYGLVRYGDVHGEWYETRICYRWDAKEGLVLAGPSEYNLST
ncbi:MAG: hypothetical protein WBY53_05585 [Acidobacteriaceae bacterium]